jgi:hypothetical protein
MNLSRRKESLMLWKNNTFGVLSLRSTWLLTFVLALVCVQGLMLPLFRFTG